MKIEILGTGCPKCKKLTKNAEEAVKELAKLNTIICNKPRSSENDYKNFYCLKYIYYSFLNNFVKEYRGYF